MVAGVRKSFERGRTYTREELQERLQVGGSRLDGILDHLMAKGCMSPVAWRCMPTDRSLLLEAVVQAPFERSLCWKAL